MSSPGDASPRAFSAACRRKGELITTVIVWLLLGAIVNIAVAWGATCLWTGQLVDGSTTIAQWEDDSGRRFTAMVHRSTAFSTIWGADDKLINPGSPVLTDVPSWSFAAEQWRWGTPTRHFFSVRDDAAGWPLGALRCRFVGEQKDRGGFASFRMSNEGIAISPVTPPPPSGQTVKVPRALPLRPIWPGFAINAGFYAAVLWMLFAAPLALRRRSRIRRGLCPKCAYPIGHSDVCSECGAAVERSARAA